LVKFDIKNCGTGLKRILLQNAVATTIIFIVIQGVLKMKNGVI